MCDTRALISTKPTSDMHSCWIIYTKNNGLEHLTVTDTKPVVMPSGNPTDLTNNNNNSHNNNANNNEIFRANGLLSTSNNPADCVDAQADADADVDADVDAGYGFTEQSLADILDPDLQPEPPIANNAESQAIYRDHRHMAKEYLSVDTNLYYAQDFKDKLILQMDRHEREQKQELLRKIKDREELQTLYNNLQQQLQKLPANRLADAHPRQQPLPVVSSSQELSGGHTSGDSVENDGWVVIAPHHNT